MLKSSIASSFLYPYLRLKCIEYYAVLSLKVCLSGEVLPAVGVCGVPVEIRTLQGTHLPLHPVEGTAQPLLLHHLHQHTPNHSQVSPKILIVNLVRQS